MEWKGNWGGLGRNSICSHLLVVSSGLFLTKNSKELQLEVKLRNKLASNNRKISVEMWQLKIFFFYFHILGA